MIEVACLKIITDCSAYTCLLQLATLQQSLYLITERSQYDELEITHVSWAQ